MFFLWLTIFCFIGITGIPLLLEAWDEHKEREIRLKREMLELEKQQNLKQWSLSMTQEKTMADFDRKKLEKILEKWGCLSQWKERSKEYQQNAIESALRGYKKSGAPDPETLAARVEVRDF